MIIAEPYWDQQSARTNLEAFQRNNHLFNDTDLFLQELTSSNSLVFNGNDYFLDDVIVPVKIFTEDAIYTFEGEQQPLPSSTVFEKEDEKEIVRVVKSGVQELKTVTIFNKKSQERVDIKKIENEPIFATIQDKNIDYDDINEKYRYGKNQNFSNQHLRKIKENRRSKIQSFCTNFRIIRLAIAYDSSFCIAHYGLENSNNKIQEIVTNVSKMYEHPDLCVKVKISYLEANCVPGQDPYKKFVDLKKSGCSSYGLLHNVRDMWETERTHYSYDAMHLFIGTTLECDEGGCLIGCAFNSGVCTQHRYGLEHITFTSSSSMQATLVAHEHGHICGAQHESGRNSIMSPIISNGSDLFNANSIAEINNTVSAQCVVSNLTSSTTSLSPINAQSSIPSTLLSSKPTSAPTLSLFPSNPSVSPFPTPSMVPSLRPPVSIWPSSKSFPLLSSAPSFSSPPVIIFPICNNVHKSQRKTILLRLYYFFLK